MEKGGVHDVGADDQANETGAKATQHVDRQLDMLFADAHEPPGDAAGVDSLDKMWFYFKRL